MGELTVRVLRKSESAHGEVLADIEVFEPNGDAFACQCRLQGETIQIVGDGHVLDYLHERYGPPALSLAARQAVLDA